MKSSAARLVENERIRGPNVGGFIKAVPGVPFEEGLAKANAENRVLVSNKRTSEALAKLHEKRAIAESLPCWTGTIAAYLDNPLGDDDNPKILGKTIDYLDTESGLHWIFPVPVEFQGKSNRILVAEHPGYSVEIEGNNRIIRATQVEAIDFPCNHDSENYITSSCTLAYFGDPKHDIPTGYTIKDKGDDSSYRRMDKRELVCMMKYDITEWVGPIARGPIPGHCVDDSLRSVIFGLEPSKQLGMLVEVPDSSPQLSVVKKMVFETASKNPRILIRGVTIDEFRALLEDANADVSALSQVLKPENLAGIRRFFEALEEKE